MLKSTFPANQEINKEISLQLYVFHLHCHFCVIRYIRRLSRIAARCDDTKILFKQRFAGGSRSICLTLLMTSKELFVFSSEQLENHMEYCTVFRTCNF